MLENLFFLLLIALIGGVGAKLLKLPSIVGYILAGVVGAFVFRGLTNGIDNIAEIGIDLLLFSVGLELSLPKLAKVGKVATLGAILQIILVTVISFVILVFLFSISPVPAVVLSLGFSFASTAVVVKMIRERGEEGTIHAEILTGWSLMQDLAVIPVVVILPALAAGTNGSWLMLAVKSISILGAVFLIGRIIAPVVVHKIAAANSRELLILIAVALALGTSSLVTLFGISAAFGAFLAGVVISETQEQHAVFSETRPLRDLFSILFFVSLGFLVTFPFIIGHLLVIIELTIIILIIKFLVTFLVCLIFDYKGKTAILVSLGLTSVGEFAFILFLIAKGLNILSNYEALLGMSVTLLSLIIAPFLFKSGIPLWRKLKQLTLKHKFLNKLFISGEGRTSLENTLKDHIIICGFGRMGKWVGRALTDLNVPYIVIDYNQRVVRDASRSGIKSIYGDPSHIEVLEAANVKLAKAIIISLPDHIAQEEIISYCQSNVPDIKIMARAHEDQELRKLSALKIRKVVQPEFEAAVAIVREILVSAGHSKVDTADKIRNLRLSHSIKR